MTPKKDPKNHIEQKMEELKPNIYANKSKY